MNPLFNDQITDPNILINVLGFLDHHGLNNMRSVDKTCNKIINETNLYQCPYNSFRDRHIKLISSVNELNNRVKKLEDKKKTLLAEFITNTASESYSKEQIIFFNCYNKFYQKILKLSVECEQLQRECKELKIKNKYYESSEKIVDLFGGKKAWEDLPNLDFDVKYSQDTLPMTAPIMKGIDDEGYNFFALRFKHKSCGYMGYLVFRPNDNVKWQHVGSIGYEYKFNIVKEDLEIKSTCWKFNPLDPIEFSIVKNLIKGGDTEKLSIE